MTYEIIFLGMCVGYVLIRLISKRKEKDTVIHKCSPHMCNNISCSVVCFEQEDSLWIKEYPDEEKPEGRTYKVVYCPFCVAYSKLRNKS